MRLMKKNKIIICILFVLTFILIITTKSNAATEYSELNEKTFYIKNAFTGKYLDVSGGSSQPGTRVQQYEYNGSDAQKWYFSHIGNGVYMLYTYVGSTIENNTRYLNMSLDVDNGINENGTRMHIWNSSYNGITQTFSLERTSNATYIIRTRCSDYTKVASLSDNLCDNGIIVHQWEYSNHSHDQ